MPSVLNTNQWISADLSEPYKFRALLIQGQNEVAYWVTQVRLQYSQNGVNWTTYVNGNGTSVFNANTDQNSIVQIDMDPPILAQHIRVNPVAWNGYIGMRFEFLGCNQSRQFHCNSICLNRSHQCCIYV